MNVDTKEHIINSEDNDSTNLSLLPSSYNKIESFDVISPPLNQNLQSQYS